MRALLEVQASACSGCGGYLPETTDPEAQYTATLPYRCKRCDALARKRESYKDAQYSEALTVWPVEGGVRGGSQHHSHPQG